MKSSLPGDLSCGTGTIGIRFPDHPLALAVIAGLDAPITSTSANISGEVSPVNPGQVNVPHDYFIEDGSFFRLRNISLAYTFDRNTLSKTKIQALKLYANVQNIKTWKHNTGYTPELGGSAIAFGVDNGSYPLPAVYTFGMNLTF